jgi:hypothetical protein
MECDPVRAGPLASLVLNGAWAADDIGPPGQQTHGPPEPIGIWQVAIQNRSSKATLSQLAPRNYWLNQPNFKNLGFATAFS